MSDRKIKAIIFDLGDTIFNYGKIDLAKVYEQASHQSYDYLKEIGQKVGSFRWYLLRNKFAIHIRYLISEITGNDFDSLAVMKRIGRKHNFNLTDQQWEQLSWMWYKPLGDLAHIEDDIKETFAKFKEMDLKVGLLSNTFVHSSTLIKHLELTDIWKYFDDAIFSYELAFRKPHKKIFMHAADKIDIDPKNIMFVGDRVKADVKGSMACGMTPVLKRAYTNAGKKVPESVPIIDNLSELPAIIKSINEGIIRQQTT